MRLKKISAAVLSGATAAAVLTMTAFADEAAQQQHVAVCGGAGTDVFADVPAAAEAREAGTADARECARRG